MAPHRFTAQRDDANFRPPLHGDARVIVPLTLERNVPMWEIPLTPDIELGFSHATGSVHLLPPAC